MNVYRLTYCGRLSDIIVSVVLRFTMMVSVGVVSCEVSDGCWFWVGAMCISNWPTPNITISSNMLKINRFILLWIIVGRCRQMKSIGFE